MRRHSTNSATLSHFSSLMSTPPISSTAFEQQFLTMLWVCRSKTIDKDLVHGHLQCSKHGSSRSPPLHCIHPNNSASRFHLIRKFVEKKSHGNVNNNLNFLPFLHFLPFVIHSFQRPHPSVPVAMPRIQLASCAIPTGCSHGKDWQSISSCKAYHVQFDLLMSQIPKVQSSTTLFLESLLLNAL